MAMSGATAKSFRNLLLNAGVFIEDFEYEDIKTVDGILEAAIEATDTEKCLGATRGGQTFTSEPEMRQVEYDGQRIRFKGDSMKDTVNASIETTLIEYTVGNLKRVLASVDIDVDGERTTIRERNSIDLDKDYMKKLSWIGDLADGGILVYTLFNPMNTGGINSTSADKNEGELSVTFTAFNDDFEDRKYAPYQIDIFRESSNSGSNPPGPEEQPEEEPETFSFSGK